MEIFATLLEWALNNKLMSFPVALAAAVLLCWLYLKNKGDRSRVITNRGPGNVQDVDLHGSKVSGNVEITQRQDRSGDG